MALIDGTILEVTPSHVRRQLWLMHPRVEVVQFNSDLSNTEYQLVAKALRKRPHVRLRAYGSYDGSITDLEFLRFFPDLRAGFSVDCRYGSLVDITGLQYLPADLQFLGLGATRKRLSLSPLSRFHSLQELKLERHTKDIDVLGTLTELTSLELRSITLPNLELLTALHQLRSLDLKLGGTRDLSLLPAVGVLEYLEIWMVRGLADVSPIAALEHLEYLHLQALRNVTALPTMDKMLGLRRVWLETMKGLVDLSPLATAPSLRQLALVDMAHLQPDALTPLIGHQKLGSVRAGLGGTRKNTAATDLLGLPSEADWSTPRWA